MQPTFSCSTTSTTGTVASNSPAYVGYIATADTAGQSGAGIFLVPSNTLTNAPAFATPSPVASLVTDLQMSCSGSLLSTVPYSQIYASASAGAVSLYKLDLNPAEGSPTPAQLGSLSAPIVAGANPLANVCQIANSNQSSSLGFYNLADPTSMFFVLHLAGTQGCDQTGTASGDQYYLIHYSDSPTTAPSPMPVATTNFYPLWDNAGALTGVVLFDPVAQSLNYYAGSGFANGGDGFQNPTKLLTGVTGAGGVSPQYAEGSLGFFIVTTATAQTVYRFTNSGTPSLQQLYTTPNGDPGLSGGLIDDNSIYFLNDNNDQTTILEAPLNGSGSTISLITVETPLSSAFRTYLSLAGSTDSVLLFYTVQTIYSGDTTYNSTLATVPTGVASASSTPLGGTNGNYQGEIHPHLFFPPGSASSDAVVFVEIFDPYPFIQAGVTSETQIVTLGGKVLQPVQAGEFFAYVGNPNNPGAIIQGANGGLSSLYTSTLVATQLLTSAGTPLVFSSDTNTVTLTPASSTILTGIISCSQSAVATCAAGTNGTGIAIDVSKNLVTTINAPNSDVVATF
jgi:hypothetical protein